MKCDAPLVSLNFRTISQAFIYVLYVSKLIFEMGSLKDHIDRCRYTWFVNIMFLA